MEQNKKKHATLGNSWWVTAALVGVLAFIGYRFYQDEMYGMSPPSYLEMQGDILRLRLEQDRIPEETRESAFYKAERYLWWADALGDKRAWADLIQLYQLPDAPFPEGTLQQAVNEAGLKGEEYLLLMAAEVWGEIPVKNRAQMAVEIEKAYRQQYQSPLTPLIILGGLSCFHQQPRAEAVYWYQESLRHWDFYKSYVVEILEKMLKSSQDLTEDEKQEIRRFLASPEELERLIHTPEGKQKMIEGLCEGLTKNST